MVQTLLQQNTTEGEQQIISRTKIDSRISDERYLKWIAHWLKLCVY